VIFGEEDNTVGFRRKRR